MDSDSDTSSLSSVPEEEIKKLAPIFVRAKKATKLVAPPPPVSPPRPKRPPSPPHEEVLADNPDIAFIVMFRSRFAEAFPGKLANFGPQDLEFGVIDSHPSPQVENLLCALLALLLNRKKPIERGHHGRALEEAVASHKSQWPQKWAAQNPLHGGKDFYNMTPSQRLDLLRTLVLWALTSSDAISTIIKDRYKQNRHADDENQPLSVQPWGNDGDKRRYFLIQGLDDTGFRVYREGNRYTKNAHWWSVAGNIQEVKDLAEKLEKQDGTQAARRLATKMSNAIPMFEATEEKRHRREYRQQRRAAFARPEQGFGIYEGRTRGKRMRYTYDEDEDDTSDAGSGRLAGRQQSARSNSVEAGPTITASGRQIRKPRTGDYGEGLLSGNVHDVNGDVDERNVDADSNSRARRSGRSATNGEHYANGRGYQDIDDAASADEWDSDKNDGDDERMPDADDDKEFQADAEDDDDDEEEEEEEEDELANDEEGQPEELSSLVVKLRIPGSGTVTTDETPPTSPHVPSEAPACPPQADSTKRLEADEVIPSETLASNADSAAEVQKQVVTTGL